MNTKCLACGHVHEWEGRSSYGKNQRFVRIKGNFTIEGDSGVLREVRLYACPICGTVIMEDH